MPDPMPVIYLSHGAPPLADDPVWTDSWRVVRRHAPSDRDPGGLGALGRGPLTVGATETVPLVYDFWGFPERYYQVQYAAPGAPELAGPVRKLLHAPQHAVQDAPNRGLDHGAYVPLVEMFPGPTSRSCRSRCPRWTRSTLIDIGRKLAPLRDEGVLIIGSGFITHNLADQCGSGDAPAPELVGGVRRVGRADDRGRDIDALLDFLHKAPAARIAHPRTEHFAPLFVTLGASVDGLHRGEGRHRRLLVGPVEAIMAVQLIGCD